MRSLTQHVVTALLLALMPIAASAQVTPGNVINLDVPIAGGWSITPTDINDHGVVTANVGCNCAAPSAMLWDKTNGWTNIGGVGPYWTYPNAINNNGVVAAMNLAAGMSHNAGLLWDPVNQWREMLMGPNVGTFPKDINDNGVVVGGSWLGGFSYSEAAGPTFFTDIQPIAINNAGVIAGDSTGSYTPAVRAVDGTVRLLAPGSYALVNDINEAGQTVGMIHTGGTWQAAVWEADGTLTAIPPMGGVDDPEWGRFESAQATSINDLGQVVGNTTTSWGSYVPFVWDRASGMREILFSGYPGYVRAMKINNNGEVIAVMQAGHDRGIYFTVPPPVPPTPQGQTEAIADDIQALVDSGVLSANNAGAIITKLDAAIAALDRGNITAAGNQLNAAINKVNSLVNSGKLTAAQGQELRSALQAVINGL